MAEIFSFLMINKIEIENKSKKDKILENKIKFIELSLSKIDKSFKF